MPEWAKEMYAHPGLLSGLETCAVLSLVGGLAIGFTRGHRETRRFQLMLFLSAFALRFVTSVAVYIGGLGSLLGQVDEDASRWYQGAQLHREWVQRGLRIQDVPSCFAEAYGSHHQGYTHLLGVFFYFAPPVRLTVAALNGCLGALTVVLIARIAADLVDRRAARFAGWAVCVFPSLVLYSALTLKEAVVLFLSVLAIYGCLQARIRGLMWRHLAVVVAAIVVLVPIRFYTANAITLAVLVGMVAPRLDGRRFKPGPWGGAVAVAVFVLLTGVLTPRGGLDSKFESLSIRVIERARISSATGNSAVVSHHDLHSTGGLARAAAEGAAHVLLAPFPWQLRTGSLQLRLVFPETMIWWWLLIARVLPGGCSLIRSRFADVLPILVLVAGLGLFYSLTFANVGLAFRQRSQLLPWFFVLASAARNGGWRPWAARVVDQEGSPAPAP